MVERRQTPDSPRRRLAARDWVDAAMSALAEGGLDAVAVEPLATRLGATKGSFYWHFAGRKELLDAVLSTWEAEHTEAVIAFVEVGGTPHDRLDHLIGLVLESTRHTEVDRSQDIELALLSSRGDPAVAAVLDRVTRRRVDYVAQQYRATGLDRAASHSRAVIAVAAYLGHLQLAATAPGTLPSGRRWTEHVRLAREVLAPPR